MNATDEGNKTIQELVYHHFLYDGSVPDILINYLLILLYSVLTSLPCSGCSCLAPRCVFTLLHAAVCAGLQLLCWLLADAYGVSLVWCGQLGLLGLVITASVS